MKLIIFFIYVPLVYSELHSLITTYTGIRGQMVGGTPEFSAVTTLDEQQIDYYDSETGRLVPRQDWMKDFTYTDTWKEDTVIRRGVQQIYKYNIAVLMARFNQTHGVHTYQRRYGCVWDDETKDAHGFDQYSYDGEDFITLDLKELRYITPVQQGFITVMKWNNDRAQLQTLTDYYKYECIDWLKKFLNLANTSFMKTEHPKVSLLQISPDFYVECHVTGFHSRETTMMWRKNGEDMHNNLVMLGESLPNEDGTFQRSVTLFVHPDDWMKDQYVCVVKHEGKIIRKILTEDEIKSNKRPPELYILVIAAFTGINTVLVLLLLIIIQVRFHKKRKPGKIWQFNHNRKSSKKPHI